MPPALSSPSGGLLDSPGEARYYDWILIDPKENPFVTFRFHYRTWSNLYQLSLAPRPDKLEEESTRTERGSVGRTKARESSGTSPYYKTASTSLPKLSSDTDRVASNQGLPSASSDLPTRLRGIIKSAPVILPPNHATRPLPEIPIKKPVAHKDVDRPVLTYTPSSLSDISEKTEGSDESTAVILPVRSDSLRSTEHIISESHTTDNLPDSSLRGDPTNSRAEESLSEAAKDHHVTELKDTSAKPEIEGTEPISDTTSKVAKAED
ncbi:hypothetical protein ACHAPM_004653 [Fusarium culmorum]